MRTAARTSIALAACACAGVSLASAARADVEIRVHDLPACDAARLVAEAELANVVCSAPPDRNVSFTSSTGGAFEALAAAAGLATDRAGAFVRVAPREVLDATRGRRSLRGGRRVDLDLRAVSAGPFAALIAGVTGRPVLGAPGATVTIRARNAGALEALDAAMSVLGVRPTLRGRSIVLGDGPAARRGEDAERPCSGDAARFALLACSELSRIRVGGTITGDRQATLLIEYGPGATIAAAVIARPGIAVGRRAVTAGGAVIEAYLAQIEPEAVVFEWRESDGTPHHTTRLPLGG